MKSIEIKFVASSHCVLRHEKFGTQDLTSWPPPMWQTLDSIPENCIGIATGALIAAKELHNQFGREEGKPLWRIFVTRQVGSNVGVIFVSMHCDIAMCVSLLSVPDGILVISKLCTLNIYVSVIESQSFDLHLKYDFKKMR